MKYKVGPTGDEVEIGQYREINKGSLKAMFSVVVYSPPPHVKASKTMNCRYFVQGDNRWFSFPSEKKEYNDGRKPDYFPLQCYLDKEYFEHLKIAILTALKNAEKEGPHDKKNPSGQKNPLPSEPSPFGEPPF